MKYREILYSDYSAHFNRVERPDNDAFAFAMFDTLYPSRPPASAQVVDLASGKGAWLRWMKSKGSVALTGVDLCAEDLEKTGIPEATLLREDLFAFLRRTEKSYDLIHAKDVIEHMTKDEVVDFLTLCRQRLLPGGELWISTFNALAPMAAQTWRGDFTHEMAFTPGSLKQVMRACGFPEVRTVCCHPVPPTLKGQLRKFLMIPISAACRLITCLRYGASADLDCRPTLLAMARNS